MKTTDVENPPLEVELTVRPPLPLASTTGAEADAEAPHVNTSDIPASSSPIGSDDGNAISESSSPIDYDEFLVDVHTLARNLDPQGPGWPLPLLIKKTDTPKTIGAKFKKKYGYSIDQLMVEPDDWEDDGTFKVDDRLCSCFGDNGIQWVLRNQDWAIEVRIHVQRLRRYILRYLVSL